MLLPLTQSILYRESLIKAVNCQEMAIPFLTHVSETRNEVANCKREHNNYPVEYLDSIGFFESNKSVLAHCGWLKKNEMRILANYNSKAVHCPTSNGIRNRRNIVISRHD